MESDTDKITRMLRGMKDDETQYFRGSKGDPILLTKRKKIDHPTLLDNVDRPRVAKTIVDPALGKYAKR